MIKYFEGTIFNVDTQTVVNTVNCTGVMGAGIALEFMLRYPAMFEDYETKCKDKRIMTGKVDYYKNEDGSMIVNFPTKWHFKYPSKLIWIEQGLQDFVKTYQKNGITSVAFPKLGTSNGGLNWNEVKILMEKYLSNLDIDVYICLDNKKEAEGIEKSMLDKFNSTNIEQLSSLVKLNAKQKDNIQKHIPYNRFWKISQTESIGMKTYSMIFKHFYGLALGNSQEPSQLSLFDL
ncbi:MAG: macro domain-containing protein [Clostridium sp.]|nr:macro domain-containing protein [Clostridium sp.]